MIDVFVLMELCEYYAHDLHYHAYGEAFYALHLLADKLDFGSASDDLKEAFYLGDLKDHSVPTDFEIHELVHQKYVKDNSKKDNTTMLSNLRESCDMLVAQIEEFKRGMKESLASGVAAILDGVSQKALVVSGLCARSLCAGVPSEGN